MVAIQVDGSKPPLFFLHGDVESGGLYCRNLARHLGPDQTFYAIAPHGSDGRMIPDTVEAMATDLLGLLLEIQPRGPILLGGFCNGGVVALEMARQLEIRGRKVVAVLMIDSRDRNAAFRLARKVTGVLAFFRMNTRARRKCFARLRWYSVAVTEASRRGVLPFALYVLTKFKSATVACCQLLTLAILRLARLGPLAEQEESTSFSLPVDRFAEVRHSLHEALEEYAPGRFGGRIVLFRSTTHVAKFPGDPMSGWGRVAATVEVHRLSASHKTCITTAVSELAEKMLPYLSGDDLRESCKTSHMAGERKSEECSTPDPSITSTFG
jgi:pimeloyl-ACP methyl ester carboxylesterase